LIEEAMERADVQTLGAPKDLGWKGGHESENAAIHRVRHEADRVAVLAVSAVAGQISAKAIKQLGAKVLESARRELAAPGNASAKAGLGRLLGTAAAETIAAGAVLAGATGAAVAVVQRGCANPDVAERARTDVAFNKGFESVIWAASLPDGEARLRDIRAKVDARDPRAAASVPIRG
jgi:hypothetical protein